MGDFKALFTSRQTIHANLVHIVRDISEVAGQADTGAERVSSGAQALAQGTMEQSATVDGLMTNVATITAQVRDSTVRCGNASELVDKATGFADEEDGSADRGHPEH